MAIEELNPKLPASSYISPSRPPHLIILAEVNRAIMELEQERAALANELLEAQRKINELIAIVNVLSP